MYSFDHDAFKDWAKEQGLALSVNRDGLLNAARINGCEEEGRGPCIASAIAHLANELSEAEAIFINGEMVNVPKFTEALNGN